MNCVQLAQPITHTRHTIYYNAFAHQNLLEKTPGNKNINLGSIILLKYWKRQKQIGST